MLLTSLPPSPSLLGTIPFFLFDGLADDRDVGSEARLSPWTLAALTAAVFLLLFSRSMSRFMDLDEHQFVAPPLLLNQDGLLPYRDYPYFHMPNLVFLYAVVLQWLPYKLLAARTVSVLCGTATVMLLFGTGWNWLTGFTRRQRWLWAGGICAIYLCSRLFTYTDGWAWNHDSAVLCATGAVLAYSRGLQVVRWRWFAFAGFLMGLAIGIRLSFGLMFVPMGLCLLFVPSKLSWRQRWVSLGVAAIAANLALAPAWYFLLTCPDQFIFGNFDYPRINTLFYREITTKCLSLSDKIGYFGKSFFSDPGNACLLLGFGGAVFAAMKKLRAWGDPAAHMGVLLIVLFPFLWAGVLGPSPTHYQYQYMLLPIMTLAIFAAIAAHAIRGNAAPRAWRVWIVCGIVATVGTGLPRWYWPAYNLPFVSEWVPVQVHHKGMWVSAHVPPGARVLTIDPMVPLEAGVEIYPDYAVGRFIVLAGEVTNAAERQRYHLTYSEQLDRLFREHPPGAIFTDARTAQDAQPLMDHIHNWRVFEFPTPDGAAKVWQSPP
jgi:hypothetical protein